MSRYLADMDDGNDRGGLRQRIRVLDNLRQLARAPHALTWIEFDYIACWERLAEIYDATAPTQPHFAALWLADPAAPPQRGSVSRHRDPLVSRRRARLPPAVEHRVVQRHQSVALATLGRGRGRHGACTPQRRCISPPRCALTSPTILLRAIVGEHGSKYDAPTIADQNAIAPSISLRTLWGLLATLNDLPVVIETVVPSRGYVARGTYKKFLEHSTVTLKVPETKWRALAARTAALIRRRAHQVRGFWRRDWRHPLAPLCAHEFDDAMTCTRCRGRKIWIAEHQRGDTSLGFVRMTTKSTPTRETRTMGEAKRKARHLSGRTWTQGKISVIANEVHCFDWSGTREDAIDLQKRYLDAGQRSGHPGVQLFRARGRLSGGVRHAQSRRAATDARRVWRAVVS